MFHGHVLSYDLTICDPPVWWVCFFSRMSGSQRGFLSGPEPPMPAFLAFIEMRKNTKERPRPREAGRQHVFFWEMLKVR